MLKYTEWTFRNEAIYVKECIGDSTFDIVVERCTEGYAPGFCNKNMWEIYCKHNPKYYIEDSSAALKFIEKFIEKYNKLLVFM